MRTIAFLTLCSAFAFLSLFARAAFEPTRGLDPEIGRAAIGERLRAAPPRARELRFDPARAPGPGFHPRISVAPAGPTPFDR
ncbi:MAG: hypothetical protein AAFW46_16345 [Pseudomonadota bacterium]